MIEGATNDPTFSAGFSKPSLTERAIAAILRGSRKNLDFPQEITSLASYEEDV